MISKLRRKLTWLFVILTMLVFTLMQVSMMRTGLEDIRRMDLIRVDSTAVRIMRECVESGSIHTIDLSSYAAMGETEGYVISISDGQTENSNAALCGDWGRELEELAHTGRKTGSGMSAVFDETDDWVGFMDIQAVVGGYQRRVYVAQADFNGNKLTILYSGMQLWEYVRLYAEDYAPRWVVTLMAMFLISRFLVGMALRPVEASIKSQRNFVASASHELKSPLAVIQVNAETLQDGNTERKQRVILEECARMTNLIHSMLALASSDAGNLKLGKQETDVDSMMIGVWEAFCENARKKDICLLLDIEEHYPKLLCDEERLTQTIGILLDNAISYSPRESTIILRARVEKENLIFSVIDHGPGIPDNEKEKVFERFYSCDPSRTDKSHYGLGLSIAQEIIKAHHGTIYLTDTPGGGCTFGIEIPAGQKIIR